jgi:hypothetical protein
MAGAFVRGLVLLRLAILTGIDMLIYTCIYDATKKFDYYPCVYTNKCNWLAVGSYLNLERLRVIA